MLAGFTLVFGFRRNHWWAWWAMWTLPGLAIAGSVLDLGFGVGGAGNLECGRRRARGSAPADHGAPLRQATSATLANDSPRGPVRPREAKIPLDLQVHLKV